MGGFVNGNGLNTLLQSIFNSEADDEHHKQSVLKAFSSFLNTAADFSVEIRDKPQCKKKLQITL